MTARAAFRAAVLFVAFALAPAVAAGPWIVPHRQGYLGVSVSAYEADGLFFSRTRTPFTSAPALFGDRELKESIVTLYAEYGVFHRTSLALTLPYVRSDAFRAFGFAHPEQNGSGDIRIMLNRTLHDGAVQIAGSIGARIAGDYNELLINAPGEGSNDFLARLSIGKSFASGAFLAADGTYSARSAAVPDVMAIYAEAGYSLPVGLTPRVFCSHSRSDRGIDIGSPSFVAPGGPSGSPSTGATGFPGTEEDVSLAGASLDYSFGRYTVGGSYVETLDWKTRNAPNGRTITGTVGLRF